MEKIGIKIKFIVDAELAKNPNNLILDNYEEKVRADINRGNDILCDVYLKHLMPKSEIDQVILELCTRIAWDGHAHVSYEDVDRCYVFSRESNIDDLVSKATYRFMV